VSVVGGGIECDRMEMSDSAEVIKMCGSRGGGVGLFVVAWCGAERFLML